jgi:2-keto-4-pentenoate hydratase/2-oxohepta-3-ene-1,7-dioic acid hydratase in catechol pathway
VKLLQFDDYRVGVLNGDTVVDVTDRVSEIPHGEPQELMRRLVERFDEYRARLEEAASGPGVPLSSVTLRPPMPRPAQIVCMAVNFRDHSSGDTRPPTNAFMKAVSAIIGPEDTMVLPDAPASIFEGEAEFALVVSKRAVNVPASEAMDYVFGYMNFIDGSARGLGPTPQEGASGGNTFYMMKSRHTFAPIGPYLVTADEVPDPHHLRIRLWNNGELKQDYTTDGMWTDIPHVIEYVSAIHPLEPGDIIALGTNHGGLHAFQDGDVIELETDGLGRLRFTVSDPLKRTWSRETRLDRIERGESGTAPQESGQYAPAETRA